MQLEHGTYTMTSSISKKMYANTARHSEYNTRQLLQWAATY